MSSIWFALKRRLILFAVVSGITSPIIAEKIHWSELPPLPDQIGLNGPVLGTHNGALIAAGGVDDPVRTPDFEIIPPLGEQVWYDSVFVLAPDAAEWQLAGHLPYPIAHSAVVSTELGIFVIGGAAYGEIPEEKAKGSYLVDEVFKLEWNPVSSELTIQEQALPPIPRASVHHAAGVIDGNVYVVAAHANTNRIDSKAFWRLDLGKSVGERKWENLTEWPGQARRQMAVAVQAAGADGGYANPLCLYLFGGTTWTPGMDTQLDRRQIQLFRDNYRYNPATEKWQRNADIPVVSDNRETDPASSSYSNNYFREQSSVGQYEGSDLLNLLQVDPLRSALTSAAVDIGQSHILFFGGSASWFPTSDVQTGLPFPAKVLAYHTITDTWIKAGEMPSGTVISNAVKRSRTLVVSAGEGRSGIHKLYSLSIEPEDTSFGLANSVVLAIYLIVLISMGFHFSRREKGTEDYFMAGRRIPWWAAGMSIYATLLSAISFMSLPALAYATNWLVLPGQMTALLFAPVVIYFYLPFFRRLNLTTAYEYLENRFHVGVRLVGSLVFVVFQLGRMAVVVYLPALALSSVTGLNIYLCVLVMGVLATLYTALGGMEAVIWTDVLQIAVLFGGLVLALVIITIDLGGPVNVFQIAQADQKFQTINWTWDTTQLATWLILIGVFSLQFTNYTSDQSVIQRYLTTRTESDAVRSLWLNGLIMFPMTIVLLSLGTALFAFFKVYPDLLPLTMENDRIVPLFVVNHMPAGISGLVIAGIFAASMSSLDSSMHSAATAVTHDFYRRFRSRETDGHYLKIGKILTVTLGTAGTLITLVLASMDIHSAYFFFQKIIGLTSSGLAGMFFLGIFTRRANATGALLGALASFVVLYLVSSFTDINFYLYALIGITTAVGIGYLVSILTAGPSKTLDNLTVDTVRKP